MRLLSDIQWRFLYTAPMIVLLVVAVRYWAREKKARAIACALVGTLTRPLLVHLAGPTISGCQEPMNLTIINAISMSLLQVLLVAYLGTEASWSNWKVDLGLGSMTGVSMAIAQGIASGETPVATAVLSGIALALGGAAAFVGIRELKKRTLLLALASAALLTTVVTFTLSAIDCLPWS